MAALSGVRAPGAARGARRALRLDGGRRAGGNGSNELIQATLAMTLGPGDVVVAPAPTFSLYRLLTSVLGGRYRPVPLGAGLRVRRGRADRGRGAGARAGRGAQLAQQSHRLRAARGRGRAGARGDRRAGGVRRGLSGVRRPDGPAAAPRRSRLVVLRTFSKALGMAGLRFGLALAHPAVAREIAKGKLPYNVNLVTLAAAAAALRHRHGARGARAARSWSTRDRLVARLSGAAGHHGLSERGQLRAHPVRAAARRARCSGGCSTSTASWCATSPAPASWRECLRISVGTRGGHGGGGGWLGEILEACSERRVRAGERLAMAS